MRVVSLPLSSLVPWKGNRNPGDVSQLRDSFEQVGQLNPLLVVDRGDGLFWIRAGHRRYAAAKMLRWEALGCITIPADWADFAGVAENMHRLDLSLAERAETAFELLSRHKAPDVARSFGWSVQHVQRVAYLKRDLCPEVWEVLENQGHQARQKDWFPFLNLDHDMQKRRLRCADKISDGAKRLKRRNQIELKYIGLSPNDVRSKVLAWVLGNGNFPENGKLVPKNGLTFSKSALLGYPCEVPQDGR